MALLLARHGETELNLIRVVQPVDTPLSPRGLRQADALGERLEREFRVGAVVSSDLARALQTAECIGARLALPVETDSRWRERNFGELRGCAYDSLDFDPLRMHEAPVGGESAEQFESRVAMAFASAMVRAEALNPGKDLLVVTHGLVLGALRARHLRPGPSEPYGPAGNASLTLVNPVGSVGQLLRWASAEHLSEANAGGPAGTVVGI